MGDVYLRDCDAGVIGLLLNECQRDAGFGHVRNSCVLETVELQIHRKLAAWADDIVPEPRNLATAHLLGSGTECMRIREDIPIGSERI